MKRSPRKDPVAGDVIQNPYSTHTVLTVMDGIVHYMDDGLRDYVALDKWRKWYVGDKKSKVLRAVGESK